jgi:hypothetical protein
VGPELATRIGPKGQVKGFTGQVMRKSPAGPKVSKVLIEFKLGVCFLRQTSVVRQLSGY